MTQPRLFNTRQEGVTSDDYFTPKWIFDALGIEFDIDVACPMDVVSQAPFSLGLWAMGKSNAEAIAKIGRVR